MALLLWAMAQPMKKGTRVQFSWNGKPDPYCQRTGVTVADEDKGLVLVAQDPDGASQLHFVIQCLTSNLTVLP